MYTMIIPFRIVSTYIYVNILRRIKINISALKNMGLPKMFDIPCHFDSQFICELDESVNEVKTFDLLEQSKFLKPLTNYRKYYVFENVLPL